MKKIRKIKKKFKRKELKIYNSLFKHRQMKFAISKILLACNKNIDVKDLYNIEKSMIDINKDNKMFNLAFANANKISKINADWKSFSEFMWYAYQTSTYYKDIKKNINNVYNKENFVEINNIKRKKYLLWLHSLPKEKDFNFIVIKIGKIIL